MAISKGKKLINYWILREFLPGVEHGSKMALVHKEISGEYDDES
jgi:hypothetical protein